MKHLLIITLSFIYVNSYSAENNALLVEDEPYTINFSSIEVKSKNPEPEIRKKNVESKIESDPSSSQTSNNKKKSWMKLNLADTILAFDNLNKLFVARAGSETEFKNLQEKCTKFTEMRKDLANLKNKEYKSVFDVLGGKTENCFADTEEQLTIACNGVLTKKLKSKKENTASTPLTYNEFKDDSRLQRKLLEAASNYQGRFKKYKLKRKGIEVDCSDTGDIMGAPYDDSVSQQEESNK